MWRNITVFLLLVISCAFSSCKLDVDDDEKLPGDKFWNPGSPANVEAYTLSIYQCFRTATTSNGFSCIRGICVVLQLRTYHRVIHTMVYFKMI